MGGSDIIDKTNADPSVAEESAENSSAAVVFFDGVCGMCNRTVDFIIQRDRHNRFLFAPLQGETAAEQLEASDTETLGSIVLQKGDDSYRRSTAIVRILWGLGGIWAFWAALMWLIPWPLRDLGYKIIGANRYRFFGKKEACRMPTPDERAKFLP